MRSQSRYALFCLMFVACHKNSAPAPGSSGAPGASAAPDATANSLAVLDGFEGEIAMSAKGKVTGKQAGAAPTNFTLQVKDGKFRVDLPDSLANEPGVGKAYALVTPADKKLYLVMDAKKQVIVVDFDKVGSQAKMLSQAHSHGGPSGNSGAPPVVQKTGKTDTVAGYKCEIWHIVQNKSSADLCIAEQGTSWFRIPLSGIPAEYAWASEITDGKHFPLRLVMNENGVESGRLEVTSIQKKPLPTASFTPPSGYNTIELEQMLRGMLGGMGMMPGATPALAPSGSSPGSMPGAPPPVFHSGAHAPKKP